MQVGRHECAYLWWEGNQYAYGYKVYYHVPGCTTSVVDVGNTTSTVLTGLENDKMGAHCSLIVDHSSSKKGDDHEPGKLLYHDETKEVMFDLRLAMVKQACLCGARRQAGDLLFAPRWVTVYHPFPNVS